jgi:structural maintenance of chromosome 2
VISGFKSYREHTIIEGFDQFFNAITGPNGSGKSNILDAICFVLGMKNLSQLRAGNLQELIYKRGQSGISKATVEIVFNNKDKESSPLEYKHFDQIRVTRQIVAGSSSKCFINGHPMTQEKVQSLFRSVQLNGDNRHFLILQGRIRKVLDMKPPEILGLIEESTGIRLFKDKKEESLKTLEKTQIQIDEINRILDTDLGSKIQRLRRERKEFEEWYAMKAEIDRRERWLVAYDYQEYNRILEQGAELTRTTEEQLEALQAKICETNQELEGIRAEIAILTERRNTSEREQLSRLEMEFESIQTRATKAQTLKNQASTEIRRYHKKKETFEGQLATTEKTKAEKLEEIENRKKKITDFQQQIDKCSATSFNIRSSN